jgi:serine/threonine protein kinase/Tfp pilus assembly protein PilF
MTPEHWQQVKDLLQAALERESSQRAAFLDEACAGDDELRREVESLLEAHEQAGSFIKAPAVEVAAELMAEEAAHSRVGHSIGPYQIVRRLGAGGMGDVYLAQDTRLGRQVALKLLPEYFTTDQERVRRFQQEARAASALSHPNVATIYDVGEADGASYIAMEYVEGQTLDTKMSGQPLDSTEIIDIAAQVADALEEAHAKGITHRDIKPGNIMVTARGQVKVLDFGLAKVTRREEPTAGSDLSTQAKTEPGVVMGTVAYMSPEQTLGREVDHRTDLFSLGVVIYEMTTGRRPFSGADAGETRDRILHAQPEAISRFNYNAPAELERIIRKCLEKDRARRYHSAHELLIDLRNLKRDIESGAGATEKRARQPLASARRRGKAINSVAVLPLINASGDPDMDYLSDGITESIINSLSPLPKLRVIARSTVFRYKGQEADPQQVGRTLNVRAVLMGRVLQRGDTLIIGTELVDVADGSQLWGQRYNRKLADVLAVQEEIAEQISEKLRLRLSGEHRKPLTKRYTDNAEAYQLYLKGRYYFWKKWTEENAKKAIEYFRQAIDVDPTYALAYAGMADVYISLGSFAGSVLPPTEVMPKAKAAAMKALEIDDTLAEAHTSLGWVKMDYDWDWAGADKEFQRAIKLNPNHWQAHFWYGFYLGAMGRFTEAVAEMKRAQELDPLSNMVTMFVGWEMYLARQYDQAIKQTRRALEVNPEESAALVLLGLAYEQKLMFEEAITQIEKAATLNRGAPGTVVLLGHTYAMSGRRDETQKILSEFKERMQQRYVPPSYIAIIYAGLGDKDQAFHWLERAYEERSIPYDLKVNPWWDHLRSDPRFTDLLRRMGLTP